MVTTFKLKKKEDIKKKINEEFIKKSLKLIILILLKQRPMSGFEIIKSINEKFGILFGSSTVYPLLHSLKNTGLLESIKEGKSIRYKIGDREGVRKILYYHDKAANGLKKLSKED